MYLNYYFERESGKLVLIESKIVDDFNAKGIGNRAQVFIDAFVKKLELGTINNGPGKF